MIQARACILATVLLHALPFAALAQPSRPEIRASSTVQDRIVPLEATVNGAKAGGWPFVERAGRLHVGPDALEEWRVRIPPDVNPIRVRGLDFIPLDAIPGFDAKLNFGALTAEITFSPDAFMGSRLVLASESTRPQPSPVLPSLFLNYDLNFQRSASGGVSSQDLGALLELGASTRWGVLTSSHVGRNLTGGSLGLRKEWLRLESTVTRHFPQSNLSLRLGDSVTRAGLWGRQVYFGGIQFGTNFSLSPGLLTQPLPLLRGVSSAPSTVELYVNDVLRKVSQVPTGPFVIDDSQGLTGSGEARLVVRDVLGREVVILQPFFSTVELLAPGLNDWSVELGAVRENLGVTNGDYGDRFVTGTWRRGISEQWTGEGRAEWSRVHQAAGAGAV
ncbi:MAG: fimbrial biosis outer rane usher protein, partial [Ramlibacter sp.]|uniref:fimbria/pilus outer membrane usher protein n=1 Tax=Ramlibacter sp. TaxID=1917967 RepID=UPI0026261342